MGTAGDACSEGPSIFEEPFSVIHSILEIGGMNAEVIREPYRGPFIDQISLRKTLYMCIVRVHELYRTPMF